MTIKKIFVLTLLPFIAISCGGKKARINFSINGAAIVTGGSLDGGTLLRAVKTDNSLVSDYEMTTEHSANIPFGEWDLHFVGYAGPSSWSGTTYCGSVLAAKLESEEVTLNVTINQSNCALEPYLTMISDKQAQTVALWDLALWDTGQWAP